MAIMGEGVSLSLPRNGYPVASIHMDSVPFSGEQGFFGGYNLPEPLSFPRHGLSGSLSVSLSDQISIYGGSIPDTIHPSADLVDSALSDAFPSQSRSVDRQGFPPYVWFRADYVYAAVSDRARSDLGAFIMMVFELPKSWVHGLDIHSLEFICQISIGAETCPPEPFKGYNRASSFALTELESLIQSPRLVLLKPAPFLMSLQIASPLSDLQVTPTPVIDAGLFKKGSSVARVAAVGVSDAVAVVSEVAGANGSAAMAPDLQVFEPSSSAVGSEIGEVWMELPPIRSGLGPNATSSDANDAGGNIRDAASLSSIEFHDQRPKASFPVPVISGNGNGVSGLPTSTIYRRSDRASQVLSACQTILDLMLLRVHLVSTVQAWTSSVPNPGEGGLPGFDFPKFWVSDLDIHSGPTPSPTTLTEYRMRLIICFEVPAQDSGVVPTSDDSSDLHGFVQPGVVPFRSVIEVCPIYADLPISGDKPLCARDDEAKAGPRLVFVPLCLFISSMVRSCV